MDEVYDFLKKCGTYHIATVNGDHPEVRPFGTVCKFENKLYVQTAMTKDVYKQIRTNPNVAICCFGTGEWLRINCKLVENNSTEAQKTMLDDYPGLKEKYAVNDGNNVVFFMKDAKAIFCSFTAEPRTVEFS